MNYIIMIIFFIIQLLSWHLIMQAENGDLASPASIVIEMSILSTIILFFYIGKLNETISLKCIAIIIIALWSFLFGTQIFNSRRTEINSSSTNTINCYSKRIIVFCLILVFAATILFYREVKKVASMYGYNNSSTYGLLYYYRSATLSGGVAISSQSKVVGQIVIASYASSYLILNDLVKRIVLKKGTKEISTLILESLVIVIYILQCILTGGRTQFLYCIESAMFLYIFYNKKRIENNNAKILNKVLIGALFTAVLFFILGSLTGKTSKLNFTETIFTYIGSPFLAFDKLINKNVAFTNIYPGSNVFIGPIDLLNRLGFNIEHSAMEGPFVQIGEVSTNIYGSYARYYNDFGLLGMIFITFFIGVLYKALYVKIVEDNSSSDLKIVLYVILSKVLFEFCIEERFFLSVISLGTILRIGYIVFFYRLFKLYRFGYENEES